MNKTKRLNRQYCHHRPVSITFFCTEKLEGAIILLVVRSSSLFIPWEENPLLIPFNGQLLAKVPVESSLPPTS